MNKKPEILMVNNIDC